jgi:hypothetical protein
LFGFGQHLGNFSGHRIMERPLQDGLNFGFWVIRHWEGKFTSWMNRRARHPYKLCTCQSSALFLAAKGKDHFLRLLCWPPQIPGSPDSKMPETGQGCECYSCCLKHGVGFFCSTWIWTQGLHLEPLHHQPFFVMDFIQDRVLRIIFPGWLQTMILLISASE